MVVSYINRFKIKSKEADIQRMSTMAVGQTRSVYYYYVKSYWSKLFLRPICRVYMHWE